MNWRSDEHSWLRRLEFPAIGAVAIAIISLMIGQSAERYADTENQAGAQSDAIADSSDKSAPAFNAIDYTTTGSIKGQTVVLSPCNGQQSPR